MASLRLPCRYKKSGEDRSMGTPCGASFAENGSQVKAFRKWVKRRGQSEVQTVYDYGMDAYEICHSVGNINYIPIVRVSGWSSNNINQSLTPRVYNITSEYFAVRIPNNNDNPHAKAISHVAFKTEQQLPTGKPIFALQQHKADTTMRRLALLLLLGVILLTACNPKQEPTQKGLDLSARLYINVRNSTVRITNSTDATTTDDPIPTPREVVERAGCFMFAEPRQGLIDHPLGIDDVQKDYEHERIMMWGGMITDDFGDKEGRPEPNDYFLKVRDLRIFAPMREGETENPIIVYIPNRGMRDAEAAITKVYNEGNCNEVYRPFQELYMAIPATTAKWRALKERGSQ